MISFIRVIADWKGKLNTSWQQTPGHKKLHGRSTLVPVVAISFLISLTALLVAQNSPIVAAQSNDTSHPRVQQVATGTTSACAVVNYKAKCWGDNKYGKIGKDSSNYSAISKPTNVYDKEAYIKTTKGGGDCDSWFIVCLHRKDKVENIPASPLYGKTVTKVSVGTNHACALANARVYCWGSNRNGQLGNGEGGQMVWSTKPVAVATDTNSALNGKEINDISVGDDFSCALSTDGAVACWGAGADGRLGTNDVKDKKYPTAVYTGSNSALTGKRGMKLAKASGKTMCVLTTNSTSTNTSNMTPVCWGYGIDDGTPLPASTTSTQTCSKYSATGGAGADTSTTKIFKSNKPVAIPGTAITSADGQDYVTGLGADGHAYYWGKYGYKKTITYTDKTSCIVDCRGKVSFYEYIDKNQVDLANATTDNQSKISLLDTTNYTIQLAATTVRPGQSISGRTTGSSFSVSVSRGGSVSMVARPNPMNFGTRNTNRNSCHKTIHYGYKTTTSYENIGQRAVTAPAATSITKGLSTLSGNVYEGLYCATSTMSKATLCDANGTDMAKGQTGSNYTRKCKRYMFSTSCEPAPVGPQSVTSTNWLAGKTIVNLSTNPRGYTCAIANDRSVGCWGANDRGQLGTGDTNNKNVPTKVEL